MNDMNCCTLSATMTEIVTKLREFAAFTSNGGLPQDTAGDFSAAVSAIAAKLIPFSAAAATAAYEAEQAQRSEESEEAEGARSVFEGLQADFEAEAITAGSMVVEALQEAISSANAQKSGGA